MDGLTFKACLYAAKMCDLAEHRSIYLQGGQDMREMGAGSITKWQIPTIS